MNMEALNKIISQLKKLNKLLTAVFNFILVFFVYWIGVSLSFLFLKVSEVRKKEVEAKTYWVDYEKESSDYRRQY